MMTMMHLIVDGLAGNEALLRDKVVLSAYVEKLAHWLNMVIIAGPLIVEDTRIGEKAGITAVAVISESHIAVHTWPNLGGCNVNIDVFSCLSFNHKGMVERICQDWQMTKENHIVLERPLGVRDGIKR